MFAGLMERLNRKEYHTCRSVKWSHKDLTDIGIESYGDLVKFWMRTFHEDAKGGRVRVQLLVARQAVKQSSGKVPYS